MSSQASCSALLPTILQEEEAEDPPKSEAKEPKEEKEEAKEAKEKEAKDAEAEAGWDPTGRPKPEAVPLQSAR